MVCQACHATVAPDVRFCPNCGAPVVSVAQMPPQHVAPGPPPFYGDPRGLRPRVARHLQVLSILWLVFGAYRVLGGVLGMFFLRTFATNAWGPGGFPFGGHSAFPPAWMAFLLPFIAITTALSALLALLSGYGLMTRRTWGRTLAIVAAIFALLKFPVGTALGIYTLWVLAPGESGTEYEAMATQSTAVR